MLQARNQRGEGIAYNSDTKITELQNPPPRRARKQNQIEEGDTRNKPKKDKRKDKREKEWELGERQNGVEKRRKEKEEMNRKATRAI